jgi:hypothetical protein
MMRSLGRLLWIVMSRHKLLTVCVIAGLWWWHRPASSPPAPSRPQAAVLANGFAAIDSANHVVEFDADGARRHELTIRGITNPSIVGLSSGLGVVWRDGKQVAAASVDRDGNPGKPTRFGKNAQLMCHGTASNAHKFAVGWTEADGTVWIVFGPTRSPGRSSSFAPGEAEDPEDVGDGLQAHSVYEDAAFAGELARPTFCAVASADRKVALLWSDGKKVSMTMCDKKCSGLPMQIGLAKGREVLGFGCIRDACVIASRNGRAIEATWLNARGKPQWTKPLRDASPDTRIALVGTGTQIAIAYETGNEPVVVAASRGGEIAPIWQGAADGVPSIQWADGRLMIARHVGGKLVGSATRVP